MSDQAPAQAHDHDVAVKHDDGTPHHQPTRVPAVHVRETDQAVVLLADLPGVSMKQVEITIEQDVLTVRGTVAPIAHKDMRLLHREYSESGFARSFTLPEGIDRPQISASVKNGVLTLILPKQQAVQPQRIAVQTG